MKKGILAIFLSNSIRQLSKTLTWLIATMLLMSPLSIMKN